MEPSADPGRVVDLATSGPSAKPLTAAQDEVAGALAHATAAALESYEETGRLGPLSAAEFASKCWTLPNPRAAFEQYVKGGVAESQIYSPMADQVSLGLADGGVLAMFGLDFKSTLVPASAGSLIDWVSDPAQEPATALMPSGQYSRITERGQLELGVVSVGRKGFRIIGAYSGLTSVAGVEGRSASGPSSGGVPVSYPLGRSSTARLYSSSTGSQAG